MNGRKKTLIAGSIALALVIGGYWYWSGSRGDSPQVKKAPPPVPVIAAKAVTGDIPVLLEVVGRAEAYESVSLKSRVDGQVQSVAFTEGQHVKQGDVLIRLDPNDFNAKLAQAEANLKRDEAQLAKSHADVQRYISLKERGFVSEEKINEFRTAEAAAAATVKADQAAVELARLQLSYTTIRAPFSGVVGARLVFPGSAVKINDTVLAVVNRIQPLYVTFAVPEKHLSRLRQSMADGTMPVTVRIPGNKDQEFEGKVRFIDNAVDAATGTIQMKALLDNKGDKLTAGQFLNVSMTLEKLSSSVLVPAEAVQQGADGNFVYVVKTDNTAELRKIAVQTVHRGMAAIASGIAADETVVTDGQLRLTQGATVAVKAPQAKGDAAKAPAATPAAAAAPAKP